MRPLALFMAAVLVLGPVGCAHRATVPTAVPEPKPDAGTVGLVVPPGPYSPNFQRPGAVGAGQGAKQGAKTGVMVPFMPGVVVIAVGLDARGDPRGAAAALLTGLAMLGAGLVLAPVGAGVGAAVGAIAAPSLDEVERSAAALERAFADANLPEALPAWIIEAGGERPIVSIADPAGPTVDTFLELEAPLISLASKDPTDWRPGLRLRVLLRGKLVRASDAEELRAWSWEHEGSKATFLEWGKDEARLFRTELESAGRALAAKVIADLY